MIKGTTLKRPPWPPADPVASANWAFEMRTHALEHALRVAIHAAELRANVALVIAGAALIAALLR